MVSFSGLRSCVDGANARFLSMAPILVGTACATGPANQGNLPDVLGCWTSSQIAGDTFGLLVDADGQPGRFLPLPPAGTPIQHRWLWIEGTDSIRINYGYGGFVGKTIRARVTGDSLIGWALPFTDEVGATPAREPFIARRTECPPAFGGLPFGLPVPPIKMHPGFYLRSAATWRRSSSEYFLKRTVGRSKESQQWMPA